MAARAVQPRPWLRGAQAALGPALWTVRLRFPAPCVRCFSANTPVAAAVRSRLWAAPRGRRRESLCRSRASAPAPHPELKGSACILGSFPGSRLVAILPSLGLPGPWDLPLLAVLSNSHQLCISTSPLSVLEFSGERFIVCIKFTRGSVTLLKLPSCCYLSC